MYVRDARLPKSPRLRESSFAQQFSVWRWCGRIKGWMRTLDQGKGVEMGNGLGFGEMLGMLKATSVAFPAFRLASTA
jgi:hypothetical protein